MSSSPNYQGYTNREMTSLGFSDSDTPGENQDRSSDWRPWSQYEKPWKLRNAEIKKGALAGSLRQTPGHFWPDGR